MNKKEEKILWYDNPGFISNLIICLTLFIIIISQSFAIKSDANGANMLWNVLNHNISYMILFVYFFVLKFRTGKRYFNYINVILICIYFISFLASIFTVFQSFSLTTLISLAINFLLFIYLFHTFFRDTRIWNEFKLANSPFNELSSSWYFYAITILEIILLAINFIIVEVFDGVVLSLLDCTFMILFCRYIYLYRMFLHNKNKKGDKDGEIDTLQETLIISVDAVKKAYKDAEIDKKVDKIKDKIVDGYNDSGMKEKVEELTNKFNDKKPTKDKKKGGNK